MRQYWPLNAASADFDAKVPHDKDIVNGAIGGFKVPTLASEAPLKYDTTCIL